MTAAIAALLFALAAAPAIAADASWNSQGGDLGNTRHAAADPAFTAAKLASLRPLWQVPLRGTMRFAPVSDGTSLFVTTSLGSLARLDRTSGQVLWDVDLGTALDIKGAFSKGNPALAGDLVVVAIHNVPALAAFEKATGKLRWKTAIADSQLANITQSPLVHDGRVFVGTSGLGEESILKLAAGQTCCGFRGSVMAFDLASGRLLWRTYTLPEGYFGGAVWSTAPAVDPKRRIVYATAGNAFQIPPDVQKCALANLHDRAALRRCYPAGVWFDSILALDERTGAIKWGFRANDYDVFTGTCLVYDDSGTLLYADSRPRKDCGGGPDYGFAQGPMLWRAGGRDLVGAGQKSGEFWALNADTGQVVWHRVVGPGSRVGGVRAQATDGKRVYLATGRIVKGDVQFPAGTEPPGPPTAFMALDCATGRTLWEVPDELPAGPLLSAGDIVLGCSNKDGSQLLAFDGASGKLLAQLKSDAGCSSGATVIGGTVYAGSGRTLRAWSTK